MFNSSETNQSVTLNTTPSVLITKTVPLSWMERFHYNSKRADEIFQCEGHKASREEYSETPSYGRYSRTIMTPELDIVVLQCVPMVDGYVMVELARRKDLIK